MSSRGPVVALLAVSAFAIRLGLALRTAVPSNDGATYLWAVETFARGNFSDGFSTVFHAGAALVIAPFVVLGASPMFGAALAASLAAMGTVLCLDAILRKLDVEARARSLAIALYVVGFHFVRLPADVYSESFSILFVALCVLESLRGRYAKGAMFAGLAFWVRPEALLAAAIPLVLVRREPRERFVGVQVRSLIALAAVAGSYVVLRATFVDGALVPPKLEFMLPLGPLGPLFSGDVVEAISRLGHNLSRLPRAAISGLDYVVFFLALLGVPALIRTHPRVAWAFVVFGCLHIAVLLAFEVKPRFFLSLAPVVYPAVAQACAGNRGAARVAQVIAILALAAAILRVTKDFVEPPRADKRIELEVGRALRAEAIPEEQFASTLPRVAWAAGHRPLPPWPWTVEDLIARVLEPARGTIRVVVLLRTPENRSAMDALPEFRPREPEPSARVDVYERD